MLALAGASGDGAGKLSDQLEADLERAERIEPGAGAARVASRVSYGRALKLARRDL